MLAACVLQLIQARFFLSCLLLYCFCPAVTDRGLLTGLALSADSVPHYPAVTDLAWLTSFWFHPTAVQMPWAGYHYTCATPCLHTLSPPSEVLGKKWKRIPHNVPVSTRYKILAFSFWVPPVLHINFKVLQSQEPSYGSCIVSFVVSLLLQWRLVPNQLVPSSQKVITQWLQCPLYGQTFPFHPWMVSLCRG